MVLGVPQGHQFGHSLNLFLRIVCKGCQATFARLNLVVDESIPKPFEQFLILSLATRDAACLGQCFGNEGGSFRVIALADDFGCLRFLVIRMSIECPYEYGSNDGMLDPRQVQMAEKPLQRLFFLFTQNQLHQPIFLGIAMGEWRQGR